MSRSIELNCWVLGDETSRIFPVKISESKSVGALKKAIKGEKQHRFQSIDADALDLWQVRSTTVS
jgi:hypothetical protein